MASSRPTCLPGPNTRPVPCCWRGYLWRPAPALTCRNAWAVCRAAVSDSTGEWSPLPSPAMAGRGGAVGGNGAPLALLDDALLQASQELQELCQLQLQLLAAALHLSLQAGLNTSCSGSLSGSLDGGDDEGEQLVRQQWIMDSSCLRCTVYCRAPASLQTGQLQLQLVATQDDSGGGGGSSGGSGRGAAAAARAQQAQRFLFLGQEGAGGASLQDQEQWILEQPVIVLPDSGGLVLPLSHKGILVGLLVVERCMEPEAAVAAADGSSSSSSSSSSSGSGESSAAAGAGGGMAGAAAMPQPPACLLFRSAELTLLKQTAAALALACAMDMRAALERVGAAYRQRQASALVQAAKKPLRVMRTLGTMLLPRLQPGEPDRDFAQGILEQGSRLQEVVSQLQAALHPAAAAGGVPLELQSNGSRNGSSDSLVDSPATTTSSSSSSMLWRQAGNDAALPFQALPDASSSSARSSNSARSSSSSSGGASGSQQWQLADSPPVRYPALPSSSIGSDFQAGMAGATIDLVPEVAGEAEVAGEGREEGAGTASGAALPAAVAAQPPSSSSSGGSNAGSWAAGAAPAPATTSTSAVVYGSRASADLLNVLMPLLASASNFASVSGISFVMAQAAAAVAPAAPHEQQQGQGQTAAAATTTAGASATGRLPAAEVAVGPGTLKRMLSQLIDGVIACAARGDLVQASLQALSWQGRPGVAVSLCCCYSLSHGGSDGSSSSDVGGSGHLPRPPLQPEFAFLQSTASDAGGWFEVRSDATPDVQHLNTSALTATLWLPTVTSDAGWGSR